MKRIIIVFTAILICNVAISQQKIIYQIEPKQQSSYIEFNLDKTTTVYDSIKGIVATQTKDTLVIIDSAATIKVFMAMTKTFLEVNKRLDAAQQILSYINTNGYVLNKNKTDFNKAVEEYFKITNPDKSKADISNPLKPKRQLPPNPKHCP